MHFHFLAAAGLLAATSLPAQLFTGVDVQTPTRSTSLAGFPAVAYTNHAAFQVNGMAALDDGSTLVIAQGPFTTWLYTSATGSAPIQTVRAGIDLHALGYGRQTLYGFSNYGSPMGIYAVDMTTGAATLAVDTSAAGYRFFGLDYDPVDDRLYGYTEYGTSGLYAIDIDTGAMTRVAASIPALNSQGRGLAVGNHIVYLTATRGLDGVASYAYDLRQGNTGNWVPFTNAFTTTNATGGSAFLEHRQANLGFRGEGHVTVSCTGTGLASGQTSTVRICTDRPNARGYALLSLVQAPFFVPQLNATLVGPLLAAGLVPLDSHGMLELPIGGGGGPGSLYLQFAMVDARAPSGWATSNAVRLDFLP